MVHQFFFLVADFLIDHLCSHGIQGCTDINYHSISDNIYWATATISKVGFLGGIRSIGQGLRLSEW